MVAEGWRSRRRRAGPGSQDAAETTLMISAAGFAYKLQIKTVVAEATTLASKRSHRLVSNAAND